MILPTGSVFYADDYGVLYWVQWETAEIDGVMFFDFTTITKSPHVWGEKDYGYISNKQVFRSGICTTYRQILMLTAEGYTIIAEGSSQIACVYQSTFRCTQAPVDNFKHHLDQAIVDNFGIEVAIGSRFTDPADQTNTLVFGDVDENGTIISGFEEIFETCDVWSTYDQYSLPVDPTLSEDITVPLD